MFYNHKNVILFINCNVSIVINIYIYVCVLQVFNFIEYYYMS